MERLRNGKFGTKALHILSYRRLALNTLHWKLNTLFLGIPLLGTNAK
jgi:hypothetical protein